MKSFTNVVLFTQEEAYKIVKDNITAALNHKLSDFLDGNDEINCFENDHNLKNNMKGIVEYFKDICSVEIFSKYKAEIIIITPTTGYVNNNAIISRVGHEKDIETFELEISK